MYTDARIMFFFNLSFSLLTPVRFQISKQLHFITELLPIKSDSLTNRLADRMDGYQSDTCLGNIIRATTLKLCKIQSCKVMSINLENIHELIINMANFGVVKSRIKKHKQ